MQPQSGRSVGRKNWQGRLAASSELCSLPMRRVGSTRVLCAALEAQGIGRAWQMHSCPCMDGQVGQSAGTTPQGAIGEQPHCQSPAATHCPARPEKAILSPALQPQEGILSRGTGVLVQLYASHSSESCTMRPRCLLSFKSRWM